MTELLKTALQRVNLLTDPDQDRVARMIFVYLLLLHESKSEDGFVREQCKRELAELDLGNEPDQNRVQDAFQHFGVTARGADGNLPSS